MRIYLLYSLVDTPAAGREKDAVSDNDILKTVYEIEKVIGKEHEILPVKFCREIVGKLDREPVDIVFNLCESYLGDPQGESWIAGYLELMEVPYTGSGPLTLALCLNKAKCKQILQANKIPTPKYQVFSATSQKLDANLNFPLIVKPLLEDASVGIDQGSVVRNKLELFKRIDHIIETYDQPAIVEEFIQGREINAAIIGNGSDMTVLPLSEIIFEMDPSRPMIVDFDAKWTEGSTSYEGTRGVCPAELPRDVEILAKSAAREAYRALGLKDYGRVDIRIRDNRPYVIEVNPNPGIGSDSGFFRSCKQAGMSYGEMIMKIISKASSRYHQIHQDGKREMVHTIDDKYTLRGVRFSDLDILEKWMNDSDITRKMDEPDSRVTREDLVQRLFLDNTDLDLILENRDGRRIGFCSVYDFSKWNGTCEISFLIGEGSARGKGVGKIMVEGMIEICRDHISARRVMARVLAGNDRSLKILRSLGFRKVGILKCSHVMEGREMDEILMELVIQNRRQSKEILSNV